MSEVWWPKFRALVDVVEEGGRKRIDIVEVQAPNPNRAEEFVHYRYESVEGWEDVDIRVLEYVNP